MKLTLTKNSQSPNRDNYRANGDLTVTWPDFIFENGCYVCMKFTYITHCPHVSDTSAANDINIKYNYIV